MTPASLCHQYPLTEHFSMIYMWHVAWQREVLANKAVYFVRTGAKGVSDKTWEADIAVGEVLSSLGSISNKCTAWLQSAVTLESCEIHAALRRLYSLACIAMHALLHHVFMHASFKGMHCNACAAPPCITHASGYWHALQCMKCFTMSSCMHACCPDTGAT